MKTTSLPLLPLIFGGIVSALLVWSAFIPSDAVAGAALEQMIESAKTKEDHETIAKHYEDEANVLQAKVEEHKKMSGAYRVMTPGKGGVAGFVAHCDKLIAGYEGMAADNRALAKLHHQFAEESEH